MATPLNLKADRSADGMPRVTAVGEIDLSNIDAFTEALNTASAGTRGPITVDLSAVKYLDSAGVEQTLDPSVYVLDNTVEPAVVHRAYGESWPSTYPHPNAVTIRVVTGYGDNSEDVPKAIESAMLLHLQLLEQNDPRTEQTL